MAHCQSSSVCLLFLLCLPTVAHEREGRVEVYQSPVQESSSVETVGTGREEGEEKVGGKGRRARLKSAGKKEKGKKGEKRCHGRAV